MQCTSRIYIKFGKPEDWKSFVTSFKVSNNEGKEYTLEDFIAEPFASYQFFENGADVSEENLSCTLNAFYDDEQLSGMFTAIVKNVKNAAIVCADSYNYSCYPETSFELFSICGIPHTNIRLRGADRHFDIDIADINKWIGPTQKKTLSDGEKAFLKQLTAKKKAANKTDELK